MTANKKNIIISGGGTGGHLFPALAVADALKKIDPNVKILFVGAKGKIEELKVPKAGYEIELLPISGFARRLTYKNLSFIFKLIRSLWIARKIVKKFKPDAVAGVGGYASGPIGYIASRRGIPLLVQEQNSYPGITNKLLARKAQKICVAYQETDRFFDKEKMIKTGNPVRESLLNSNMTQAQAKEFFGFSNDKKLILCLGGSGGAKSINEAIAEKINQIKENNLQLLWQTGAFYFDTFKESAANLSRQTVNIRAFIERMDIAYKAADLVISRAGAGTISELCILKKPAVLVPSPHVAEDHQSKNAQTLTNTNAALYIADAECKEKLIPTAVQSVQNSELLKTLSENIYKHAVPDSAERIAGEILNLIKK